jgi:hypothetical protein
MRGKLLCALLAVLALGAAHAQQPGGEVPAQIREIVGRKFVAYSSEFANRFKLPASGIAAELNSGLEAIELGFESPYEAGSFVCYAALYLRSSVPVDAEELGAEASWDTLRDDRHFFLRPRADGANPRELMAREDAVHLGKRQARYYQRIGFSSKDYSPNQSGGQDSKLTSEHVAELFPGIRYIRTRGCMSSRMIAHGKGVNVVLRRQGAPDYSRISGPWPVRDDHFIRLPLPDKLLLDAMPTLRAIEEHQMSVIDERNRARRREMNQRGQ